jgi:hypothetical protein
MGLHGRGGDNPVMLSAIGRVNPSWASQLLVGADSRLQNMLDEPTN